MKKTQLSRPRVVRGHALPVPSSDESLLAPAGDGRGMSARVKLVTLKDVARRGGVHFTTVSLALRGHPRIPVATRDRLVALAKELGYRRDPVMMALTERRLGVRAAGRRPLIALLSNHPTRESFAATEHMRLFLAGAREQAESCGYECELMLAGAPNPTGAALERELLRRGCAGVIFAALHPDYAPVRARWTRFALAKIDARYMDPPAPFASNDQMQVVRLACQRARALGYRRPGLEVGAIDEQGTQHLFTAGWLIEQESMPPAERVPILHHAHDEAPAVTARRLRDWVCEHRVDIVLGNSDYTNELLKLAGLRVPRDVAFACVCRTTGQSRIAGIVQDHRLVGAKAAELVVLGIKTGQRGNTAVQSDTYVPGRWCDGPTAPRRP